MSNSPDTSVLTRKRESNRALWVALAISALLHVPLLIAVPHTVEHEEPLERTDFNSAEEFSVNVVDDETDDNEEEPEDDDEFDGQFISMPAPEKQERPDEARFRDQYDSKTDQEMVKPSPSSNLEAPANRVPDQGGVANNVSRAPDRRGTSSRDSRERTRNPSEQLPERQEEPKRDAEDSERAEADPQEADEGANEKNAEAQAEEGLLEARESGEAQESVDPQELFPSYADASGVAGGGGGVDYMRDVPEGNKNLLNRKRSRYWSFMDRIRRQVVQHWSPVAEYRKRDPTGDVYGVKDKVSILGVTLNGDGSVRKIYVAHPSGLDFYDDEAVRAIRAAAPFHNPPEGIKDEDGLVHFNFMFVLSIDSGGGPLLRIRRR
mgnify:CR=1 FL=1